MALTSQQISDARKQLALPVNSTETPAPATQLTGPALLQSLKSGGGDNVETTNPSVKPQITLGNVNADVGAQEKQRADSVKETYNNYATGKISLPQAALNVTGQLIGATVFDTPSAILKNLGVNIGVDKGSIGDKVQTYIANKIMEKPQEAYDNAQKVSTQAFNVLKQANETTDPVEKKRLTDLGKQLMSTVNIVHNTLSGLGDTLGENQKSAEAVSNIGMLALGAETAKKINVTAPIDAATEAAGALTEKVKSSLPKEPEPTIYSHGTSPESAQNILKNGFDTTKQSSTGVKAYGDSVNLALTPEDAATRGAIGMNDIGAKASVLDAVPKKGLKLYDLPEGIYSPQGEALKTAAKDWNLKSGAPTADPKLAINGEGLQNYLKSQGYEGVKTNIPDEGISVFDSGNVKFFKQGEAKAALTKESIARENTAIADATPDYENSTPTQRQKLLDRVQEGGTLKGRTVKSNAFETEAGQEVSKIPEYNPSATKLEKFKVVKNEIGNRGKALSSSLEKENILVPKKEVVSTVRNAINQVPEDSLLLQKSDPVIKNYIRVLNNAADLSTGTLKGVLELRKKLDAIYENARGKAAFGSDKVAALDEVHTAARDSLTQYLIDHAKNTDVKAALRSQFNLYRALDQLQLAAERESGTSIGRFLDKNPAAKTGVNIIKKAIPFGLGSHLPIP